ncbi:molybdenum cofactor guanylyltransferase [Candidatus Poribacteria bacterium]|nr:molybdenum cofactor guanylyltransferase [Candidatus Poribacteria bacterium]
MRQNKALMRLGDDTLIEHVIQRIRSVTNQQLLITNSLDEYAHLNIPMHSDIVPNCGALGGIYTGLTYATNEVSFCVGCDIPFLQEKLISYLVSIIGEYDAVLPYTIEKCPSNADNPESKLQTLCAVYSKRCLPIIESMLKESELRVHALQERANVLCISPEVWKKYDSEGYSFFNINTPEDFEQAQSIYHLL